MKREQIKRALGFVGSLCILATLPAGAIQYTLSVNDGVGVAGPYATVVVDRTSSTMADITITALSGFKFSGPAFNVNGSGFSVTGGWSITENASGTGGYGGLGKYNLVVDTGSAAADRLTALSFTLTASSAAWTTDSDVLTLNSKNYLMAAHVYPEDGSATGHAANGAPTSLPDGGTTVLLLGAALSGLGAIAKRIRA